MVMGQGSAGLFFTYLLKRAGAQRVIVSDLSAARLAVAQAYGADECLNAAELGNAGVIEAVRDMTDGVGADYVVEAVGRSDTFLDSVELARIDGALLWFGLPSTDDNIPRALPEVLSQAAHGCEHLRRTRGAGCHVVSPGAAPDRLPERSTCRRCSAMCST